MRISDWSSDVCSSDLIAMRMKWALLHTAMAWAVPVAAQTEPDSEKADGAEIVVVGSRGAPRLVTESAVPVDVLSKDALSARGDGELSKILEFLSPSFKNGRAACRARGCQYG